MLKYIIYGLSKILSLINKDLTEYFLILLLKDPALNQAKCGGIVHIQTVLSDPLSGNGKIQLRMSLLQILQKLEVESGNGPFAGGRVKVLSKGLPFRFPEIGCLFRAEKFH